MSKYASDGARRDDVSLCIEEMPGRKRKQLIATFGFVRESVAVVTDEYALRRALNGLFETDVFTREVENHAD